MNGLVGEDRTRKYDPKAREKHPIRCTQFCFARITVYTTIRVLKPNSREPCVLPKVVITL